MQAIIKLWGGQKITPNSLYEDSLPVEVLIVNLTNADVTVGFKKDSSIGNDVGLKPFEIRTLRRVIIIINGSDNYKSIQVNNELVTFNSKGVWAKYYSSTTPIEITTNTYLEFRLAHSETDYNNNDQWIFPDQHLNAQAGEQLLTISQTYDLFVISVFYITQ